MTYAVSNLYGRLDKFNELLEKIKFTDDDYMYILGDMVGFGNDSLKLVNDISMRYNVYAILGKEEMTAHNLLAEFERILKSGDAPSKEFSSGMLEWVRNGGAATLEAFKDADADTREGFLDYLNDLPNYEEAFVGVKEFYLINKGFSSYKANKNIDDYSLSELIEKNIDLKTKYFEDKILVCGYFDDENATEAEKSRAMYGKDSIVLSYGADKDGKVACVRLEDGKEFYV